MTIPEMHTAILALQADLKDLRRDALEPIPQLTKEIDGLRKYDGRLLATIRKTQKDLELRIDKMAATVADLTASLQTLSATVASVVNALNTADPAAVDAANTTAQTLNSQLQTALTPHVAAAPTVAGTGGTDTLPAAAGQ